MSTRDRIVKSAVGLFIKQGVDKTTTKQIATSASVAEGSIYRYFPSKEELAWQVFKDYHQYLAQQLQDASLINLDFKEKVNAIVGCFLQMADDDWLMFRYYLTSQHTHMKKVTNEMLTPYKVITMAIEEGVAAGQVQSEDINVITAMVMGAVHQIAINKIYSRINGELYKHKQLVAAMVANMLIDGSKTNA